MTSRHLVKWARGNPSQPRFPHQGPGLPQPWGEEFTRQLISKANAVHTRVPPTNILFFSNISVLQPTHRALPAVGTGVGAGGSCHGQGHDLLGRAPLRPSLRPSQTQPSPSLGPSWPWPVERTEAQGLSNGTSRLRATTVSFKLCPGHLSLPGTVSTCSLHTCSHSTALAENRGTSERGCTLFVPQVEPRWCQGLRGQYGQHGPRPPPTRNLRSSSTLSKPRSQVPRRPDDVLTFSRPHRGTCHSPESPEPSVCAQPPTALRPGSQAPL